MSKLYVVICPSHGKQIISSNEYFDTIMNPRAWECPICPSREVKFDDIYEGIGMMRGLEHD